MSKIPNYVAIHKAKFNFSVSQSVIFDLGKMSKAIQDCKRFHLCCEPEYNQEDKRSCVSSSDE